MLLQYVSNALYDTSRTKHKDAWSQFSDTVVNEICGYNDVLLSFSETVVSDVAGSINNAYLESMGTGGSISYNLVVKLAVGYFSDK